MTTKIDILRNDKDCKKFLKKWKKIKNMDLIIMIYED